MNFPGGPVVKTLCFQGRVPEFNPWLGKFCTSCSVAPKREKTTHMSELVEPEVGHESTDQTTASRPILALPPALVNKALLKHNQSHLPLVHGCFHSTTSMSSFNLAHSPRYLLSHPIQKKFTDPSTKA